MFFWLLETLKYWQITAIGQGCRGNIGRKKWYVGRKVPADQWCYSVLKLEYQTLISRHSNPAFRLSHTLPSWRSVRSVYGGTFSECWSFQSLNVEVKSPRLRLRQRLHCCLRHANLTAGSHQRSWRDMNYTGMEVKMVFRWTLKTNI